MLLPLAAAAVGLAGSLAATLFLHRAASRALDQALDQRLRGAGESAALLLGAELDAPRLHALMLANSLEGAMVLDGSLRVLADASGHAGARADLLRVDPARVRRALGGEANVGASYSLDDAVVATGYFPLPAAPGRGPAVLALEAGQAFAQARRALGPALALGVVLSLLGAGALAALAARWSRAEAARTEAAQRAARGEAMTRMAAMAAHEIRNPLGVIRGTVELMRERAGPSLAGRDRAALQDVLGEVERLRDLTEDFLDLAADRALALARLDLTPLLEEASRAIEAAFPRVRVRRSFAELPHVEGDPRRLRQVFVNLLANAAQAQSEGELELHGVAEAGEVRVSVRDQGPGIPPEVRARLFDPFMTTKEGGTGLGLAVSKRLVERHDGALELVHDGRRGATFQVRLPALARS